MHPSKQHHKIDSEAALYNTVAHHLQKGDAIALWQSPGTDNTTFVASYMLTPYAKTRSRTSQPRGFVLAPFECKKGYSILNADTVYSFESSIARTNTHTKNIPLPFYTLPIDPMKPEEDKLNYIERASKCVEHIKNGIIDKVVLSRRRIIHLPNKSRTDPLRLFQQLCSLYPHAFVSLVSTSATGTWVGASPELLLYLDKTFRIKTTALAGTQPVVSEHEIASTYWGQKERDEQALVSQHIAKCLDKVGLDTTKEHGPITYRAGNVLHLKTDFEATIHNGDHRQLADRMLHVLHPTPAVCGSPKKAAEAFVNTYEPFNRQLYSGYIGPMNVNHESHIYVNLRCMQWTKNAVVLYAGAGITCDSVPEKEWEETRMKMNTMLHALNIDTLGIPIS